MITIICPTRGRAPLCKRMMDSARATALKPLDFILGIGGEDGGGYDVAGAKFTLTDDLPTIHVINKLAEMASGNLIMVAADDTIFSTPGWDAALEEHYAALENKIHVYALRDSRDATGTPHPIVTREFLDAMGYFFVPIFLHWYPDTWLSEIAKANNCFTHMTDYLLIHDKPSDRGQGDETHNRIRRMGWHARDSYVHEHCQHFFALEKSRLKMKMI